MLRLSVCFMLISLVAVSAFAQKADSTAAVKQKADTTAAAAKQQVDTAAAALKQTADTTAAGAKQKADTTAAATKQGAGAAAVVVPAAAVAGTAAAATAVPAATTAAAPAAATAAAPAAATAAAAPAATTASAAAPAQQTAPPPAAAKPASQSGPKKVYYGGTVGMSFGDYTRISITPLIGYKVTPRFHIGGKVSYEYIEDSRYSESFTSSNYGGSVFTRLLLTRRIYAHAEFADISYEYRTSSLGSDRSWVPFLYVGGGLIQPLGKSASAYLEVLVDVLQDDKSPYEDWTPFVSAGIGVGF